MRAIEILSGEHRLLIRVLQCLEKLLQETRREDSVNAEGAAKILEFLERFADGCHQDKEEEVLFPRLLSGPSAGVCQRVQGLLEVHEGERKLLDELRERFEGACYGDLWSLDLFAHGARTYIELQRHHAATEDRLLFPLAEELLGQEADDAMLEDFERIDRRYLERFGQGPEALGAELCSLFGIGCEANESAVPEGPRPRPQPALELLRA